VSLQIQKFTTKHTKDTKEPVSSSFTTNGAEKAQSAIDLR